MNDDKPGAPVLVVPRDRLALFTPIFQKGFFMQIRAGRRLHDLLCGDWGFAPQLVADRITTVLVDGRAVDDLTAIRVPLGATVALSASMPGLVGAVFRRQSYLASFRRDISQGVGTAHSGDRGDAGTAGAGAGSGEPSEADANSRERERSDAPMGRPGAVGFIKVKLFNDLIPALGSRFLELGMWVDSGDLPRLPQAPAADPGRLVHVRMQPDSI